MAEQYALAHALVAALPVNEVVTTNYDQLIELASTVADRPVSALPHAPQPEAARWLLKMHGCVSRPRDIVLDGILPFARGLK
jgi:hypothetical protein